MLRQQGLLAGTWCRNPVEALSPGQEDELTRVSTAYPWPTRDDVVKEHLDDWPR